MPNKCFPHLQALLRAVYRAIHDPYHTYPLEFSDADPFHRNRQVNLHGVMGVLHALNSFYSAYQDDPQAYLLESHRRAAAMQEAAKLRAAGDNHQAHLIEAEMRGHATRKSSDGNEPPSR